MKKESQQGMKSKDQVVKDVKMVVFTTIIKIM